MGTLARKQPTTWLASAVVSLGHAAAQDVAAAFELAVPRPEGHTPRQGPGTVSPQLPRGDAERMFVQVKLPAGG